MKNATKEQYIAMGQKLMDEVEAEGVRAEAEAEACGIIAWGFED